MSPASPQRLWASTESSSNSPTPPPSQTTTELRKKEAPRLILSPSFTETSLHYVIALNHQGQTRRYSSAQSALATTENKVGTKCCF